MKKTNLIKSLLTFRKATDEQNYLGFAKIEVLHFNYDGEGTALILEDGELGELSGDDLRELLFGFVENKKNTKVVQKKYELVSNL